MNDDQYDKLFKYMHSEFTVIKDQLAKKSNAADVSELRDDVNFLRGETSALGDQVANLDSEIASLGGVVKRVDAGIASKLDEHHEIIGNQLNEIQNAIGEAFIEEKARIDQHESWIDQIASTAGTRLKRAQTN